MPLVLKPTAKNLRYAAAVFRAGGVVVYPTETAYAIGARFDSRIGQHRLLRFKKRTDRKFTLVAASFGQVARHFRLTPRLIRLARRHWPGPLSVVVNARFAVRVPGSAVARRLCRLSRSPLIATSVNVSGQPPAYFLAAVLAVCKKNPEQPDIILDGGTLSRRSVSTIVADRRGKLVVLRRGAVRIASAD